jgi:hypothetical protein
MLVKPMSVYINNKWVHRQGYHWIAEAIAFSDPNPSRSPA